jgi:hypothetical protein
MPALSGPDLVGRVRALCPGLPVALMSGNSGGQGRADLEAIADAVRIDKPYTLAELSVALQTLFAHADRRSAL